MEKCWLCSKVFSSITELKTHLVSKDHRRQSVVCPWCYREQRTFTRVSDLSAHCKQRHFASTNHLPRNIFSVSTGFYMSIYPEDYARIITPAPWDSVDAMEARRIMSKWIQSLKDPGVKSENWRKGWRSGLKKTAIGSESKLPVEKREQESKVKDVKKGNVTVDKDEVLDLRVKKQRSRIRTLSDSDTDEEEVKRQQKKCKNSEDESAKETESKTSESVKDDKNKDKVIEVSSKKQNLSEEKQIACENGKVKRKETAEGSISKETVNENITLLGTNEMEKDDKESKRKELDEYVKELWGLDNVEREEEIKVPKINEKGDNKSMREEVKRAVASISEETKDLNNNNVKSLESLLPMDIVDILKPVNNDNQNKINKINNKRSEQTESSEKSKRKLKLEKNPETGHLRRTIQQNKVINNTDTSKNTNNEINSSYVATKLSMCPNNGFYSENARQLLKTGMMPLFPPARRDWHGQNMELEIGERIVVWPPNGWISMTPDRKLLAWEYTAMMLEEALSEKQLDPKMSRAYLLDKYNFLALPGGEKIKIEESERASAKSRFYLFQMLKEIANGKSPSSVEIAQINMFNANKNPNDTIVQLLEKMTRVPLRLN